MPVVNPTVHTEQAILNSSFDETFGVLVTEPVRRNSGGTALEYYNPATEEKQTTLPGFAIPAFDYIAVGYPDSTTETYTYKTGGSGGTTVAVLTVVYTDATKANINTVTKS